MKKRPAHQRTWRVGLGVAAALAMACPAAAQSPSFEGVWVHGPAVSEPRLIQDPDVAMCMWLYSYNFFERRAVGTPQDTAASVVLSFLPSGGPIGTRAEPPDPFVPLAGFHTRILVAPAGEPVTTQFKKPQDTAFETRMELLAIAEVYYSSHSVPTRLDDRGTPVVRSFTGGQVVAARTRFDEMFGRHLPSCRP